MKDCKRKCNGNQCLYKVQKFFLCSPHKFHWSSLHQKPENNPAETPLVPLATYPTGVCCYLITQFVCDFLESFQIMLSRKSEIVSVWCFANILQLCLYPPTFNSVRLNNVHLWLYCVLWKYKENHGPLQENFSLLNHLKSTFVYIGINLSRSP